MKNQDLGLLLKLVSLQKQEKASEKEGVSPAWPLDWMDWDNADERRVRESEGVNSEACPIIDRHDYWVSLYTARALEKETGISKSQINLALNRCIDVGLAKKDRKTGVPRANTQVLFNFIVHGIKYVFPVKSGEITRGISTAFAAPVLNQKLMSAGEFVMVWPDARGSTKGQSIEPLFKSATYAIKRDPELYALLALVDAIRIGQPREAKLAADMLQQRLGVK